jgi:hypothetical protein
VPPICLDFDPAQFSGALGGNARAVTIVHKEIFMRCA